MSSSHLAHSRAALAADPCSRQRASSSGRPACRAPTADAVAASGRRLQTGPSAPSRSSQQQPRSSRMRRLTVSAIGFELPGSDPNKSALPRWSCCLLLPPLLASVVRLLPCQPKLPLPPRPPHPLHPSTPQAPRRRLRSCRAPPLACCSTRRCSRPSPARASLLSCSCSRHALPGRALQCHPRAAASAAAGRSRHSPPLRACSVPARPAHLCPPLPARHPAGHLLQKGNPLLLTQQYGELYRQLAGEGYSSWLDYLLDQARGACPGCPGWPWLAGGCDGGPTH